MRRIEFRKLTSSAAKKARKQKLEMSHFIASEFTNILDSYVVKGIQLAAAPPGTFE